MAAGSENGTAEQLVVLLELQIHSKAGFKHRLAARAFRFLHRAASASRALAVGSHPPGRLTLRRWVQLGEPDLEQAAELCRQVAARRLSLDIRGYPVVDDPAGIRRCWLAIGNGFLAPASARGCSGGRIGARWGGERGAVITRTHRFWYGRAID